MKRERTELVFILDKSGSMSGLENDTIGGYNAMLARQKKDDGDATVTTVLFDDQYELLHDRIPIRGVAPLTDKDYRVGGCTALLDALGKTIHKIINVQRNTREEERAGKVLFVITTDGLENASREYAYAQVRRMVTCQIERHAWEFIFLGANMDAVAAAADFGISEDRAANFKADATGVELNFSIVSDVVSDMRAGRGIRKDWKEKLEEDKRKR